MYENLPSALRLPGSASLRRWACAAMVVVAVGTSAVAAAHAGEEASPVTRHRIQVGGKALDYTAQAGRIAIRDVLTGEPHAYMFYTAYRLRHEGRPRPVTFVWGGGPGGASLGMDFDVAGPRRVGDGRVITNELTWLTDTDVVVIDQVGTGYSRPARPEYAAEFNGTIGDTNSFAEFIRCWRIRHDAEDAPIFLAGISWGAPRAATVAHVLARQGLPVHGMVMMTGETSLNTSYIAPDLFEALRVVGMAEVARFHGRLAPELGADRVQVEAAADAWVRNTYHPALQRRAELTPRERAELAAGLSRFIGIPVDRIDHETLVVTPRQFRNALLEDQGKSLYGSDLRLTEAPRRWSEDIAVMLRSVRHDLQYRTDLPYRGLGMDTNEIGFAPSGEYPPPPGHGWDYATSPVPREQVEALVKAAAERGGGPAAVGTPLPATEEAVALRPDLRVLILLGRYDGESTCPANAEVQRNLPPPLQRAMTFKCYDSGHTPWRTPGVDAQLAEDVRAFVGAAR